MKRIEMKDAYDLIPAWRFTQPSPDKPKAHRRLKSKQLRVLPFPQKYAIYMRSSMWFKFRARIFRQRGAKCEECRCLESLELHHLHYKNFTREKPEDVKILCIVCHARAHGRL